MARIIFGQNRHHPAFPLPRPYQQWSKRTTPDFKRTEVKTIKFDDSFVLNEYLSTRYQIQRFVKNQVNPKVRYHTWDSALKKSTKMGELSYQGVRTLVNVMQKQEGWKLDATFYSKLGFHSREYKIRRVWNLKKGRQRKTVMWESQVKEWSHIRKLYLGSFHATVL